MRLCLFADPNGIHNQRTVRALVRRGVDCHVVYRGAGRIEGVLESGPEKLRHDLGGLDAGEADCAQFESIEALELGGRRRAEQDLATVCGTHDSGGE